MPGAGDAACALVVAFIRAFFPALLRSLSALADAFVKRGVAACQRFATGAS
ncbi:hypothetical protein SAMN04487926_12697 [Paraburkholderia steynii]|uniref:Uncharacterized protein n=1 Tax=Paraburkholderia steynii TaxID=1245441 RepID=A0A7Z7BDJ2_9BURK|nr:hypothetical protein SAMN04487926_12697 [Paraburkholderia steynii]